MDSPAFLVCSFMENFICLKRVKLIFSASPSEAPKTANIRPIASSPAAVKPQTVPVQPQSAASKATASIRPMAIAATSVAPLSTTTGTPTATVMPTTQSQQEAEGMIFLNTSNINTLV